MHWGGRHVLVTGAGGFIGSHLTERLVQCGARVRALTHYNALGSWGWLDHSPVKNDIEVVAGDVCDRDSMRHVMKDMDTVFHLAALIGIPYSYTAPLSYIRTNIEGTHNVMQAARELELHCVVHTSTSEVYGTARRVPIDEEHPLQAQSPYSASKIGADKVAEAFHRSFGVPVVTVRPFNTYGPRQSPRAVIPTIISQCLARPEVLRLGNVTPTRDLTYVADTVDGFLAAGACSEALGRTVNLGSGREISIAELARLIGRLTGCDVAIDTDAQRVRPKNSEVERLLADVTLARELIGWASTVSLEEGLGLTIEWMRENLERYRPNSYTV